LKDTNELEGYEDYGFLSNKKKEKGEAIKKKKTLTLFSYTRNYVSSFLFLSFSIDMSG